MVGWSLLVPMVWTALSVAADSVRGVRVRSFQPERPISRAKRPAPIAAVIENRGDAAVDVRAKLVLPKGVRVLSPDNGSARIDAEAQHKFTWQLEADAATDAQLQLEVLLGDKAVATAALRMPFLEAVEARKLDYIPEPKPVQTSVLIGAHHCPLWEADKYELWANVLKHPERTPALGFYAQENPEINDWETKWAVEHGISFFVYCWYRDGQGGAVKTRFGTAIHDGLFKSRFADKMKFTIMWENQSRGRAGVADEKDLVTNLLPYWIDNYFKHPSYLKIANRPVLYIYRPEFLVQDLGSVEKAAAGVQLMRDACRKAGFAGLYVLGEYRGQDPKHLTLMKRLGLDYTFAYCWHVPNSPTPKQAIEAQLHYIRKTQELAILPQVVTVSQAWSGWHDEGSIWKIPPREFETLLREAKAFIAQLPATELGSKMLLLDNWNEWGEGHYIAPYREYGFGYLDAVRRVFSSATEPHVDLIPDDVGMGPYDTAYRRYAEQSETIRPLLSRKAQKPGHTRPGLIGWWAFDEAADAPVAFDCAGHRLNARLSGATRAPGVDGNALVCSGGCAIVEPQPLLSPTNGLTVQCWVKTDQPGQSDRWIVNRILSGSTWSGFRLGLSQGKPCFAVPLTSFSHHLTASQPLPLGRWVHLAGTFDGQRIRLYVDGQLAGTLDRPGQLKPCPSPLYLGNYALNHRAHFVGLLDEVQLYDRALGEEEIGGLSRVGKK